MLEVFQPLNHFIFKLYTKVRKKSAVFNPKFENKKRMSKTTLLCFEMKGERRGERRDKRERDRKKGKIGSGGGKVRESVCVISQFSKRYGCMNLKASKS